MIAYIPRIDHNHGMALVVRLYPGEKLCARITTRPLAHTLLPATSTEPAPIPRPQPTRER